MEEDQSQNLSTPDKVQPTNPLDDPEEQAHLRSVVAAFFFYQYETIKDIARVERDFSQMPQKYLQLLPFDYKQDRVQRLKDCTRLNQFFLN